MKKLRVVLISFFLLTGVSWGQDAMYFYNLGLDSSIAYRKIHYFTKALELNPKLADSDFKKALNLDPEYDIYKFFSITDYLANSSGKSGSIKAVGRMGAALIIAIFFVLIFKLTLSAPRKHKDD